MNTKQLLNAALLGALGFSTSAMAETYEGVLTVRSDRPRAQAFEEARQAARNPVAGEASFAENVFVPRGTLARDDVRRAAVSNARAGNLHGDYAGAGVLSLQGASAAGQAQGKQARDVTRADHPDSSSQVLERTRARLE
ncbi:hypothetical protein [Variovorax sp. KK3]|uniref:hypothetical protein n=1 Tax=Variovorax sp. KK3 TaxID=1855728 RepID=UPI00117DF3BD|nr:hypothetical protein [Variovorax sp. KK3]